MKRILINATHNEEIRVALCKDNHLYDFDLENRTREQKKANIYKGHVTRVEPSLEAVFVEYGSARQGFLPLREIAPEYLKGNPRTDNMRDIIKEGDELIIQIEKEERGNKGAAISTYISLAGRYLVLMPNNQKAGGISRQISGKVREEMKQIINSLSVPQGMSVIVRTAGIGKGFEDLQNDLNHLLDIWSSILEQNRTRPSPCLVHQEAGVVTRAVRDYLRDDIGEVWIDSENAYNEAANFIAAVMPNQMSKLRKYTDYEPLFVRFGIERQIESAYQREVRLPSGGSIVIDQTEALVSIDINSSKSTKGSDVAETAYHTNLEAADEIARQLRLRDMGGLIVIDFIDMNDPAHQKAVEKRLIDATRYDRARVQFAEISKFGLMEMSRQRLRPSLEEATGYLCPRCHGNGMIRDLRSLALSIMRQIEQIALKERFGEIQAEVPTEIAAFLLNEKRESLVYLEQDSGVRITVLPHAHLESPNFSLHFNPDGFAPASYERIVDMEERENVERGYEVNWQTKHDNQHSPNSRWQQADSHTGKADKEKPQPKKADTAPAPAEQPQAVAWLSNLFAPKPQASLAPSLNTNDVASAIEALVNGGASSLGASGQINLPKTGESTPEKPADKTEKIAPTARSERDDKYKKKTKPTQSEDKNDKSHDKVGDKAERPYASDKEKADRRKKEPDFPKRETRSERPPRGEVVRGETLTNEKSVTNKQENKAKPKAETGVNHAETKSEKPVHADKAKVEKSEPKARKSANPNEVVMHIKPIDEPKVSTDTVHLSLDGSKPAKAKPQPAKTKSDVVTKTVEVAKAVETSQDIEVATDSNASATTEETPVQAVAPAKNQSVEPLAEGTQVTDDTQSVAMTEEADDLHAQNNQNGQTTPNTDKVESVEHVEKEKSVATAEPVQVASSTEPPQDPRPLINAERLSVLSVQMNKAINDPRVVATALREQLAPALTPVSCASDEPSVTPAIKGTAGEFVKAVLGEALAENWRDDFVATFLLAMNKATKPQHNAPQADTPNVASEAGMSEEAFASEFAKAFVNYGYAPLSAEYLEGFAKTTTSGSQWHIGQGKTAVDPRPIGERAVNDPRGQHPDFGVVNNHQPVAVDEPAVSEPTPDDVADSHEVPSTDEAQAEQTVATSEPSLAPLDITKPTPNLDEPLEPSDDSDPDDIDTSLLGSAGLAMDKVLESAELFVKTLESMINGDDEENKNNEDDEGNESNESSSPKTTPASYKDMIESVSGQLLQPTGLLNLVAPKKPKTKTPKPPKAPAKRTSKIAQKAEVVKRPKVNEVSNDDEAPTKTDDNQE